MANRVTTDFRINVEDRDLRNMVENLGDAEDRAKAVADALSALADEARADFERGRSATKAMSTALGPEFASDLGQGEAAVADLVERLKRLGLTYEEIEANADQLAVSARKLDDLRLDSARSGLDQTADSTRRAKGDIDQLTDSGRGANSALANMVGNSAQDLGQLAGVAGSSGVALGQMAEYASDARLAGEGLGSSLKNMALVAGPIAAVGLGVQLLGGYLNDAKEKQRQLKQATDEVTDALFRAQDAGEDLNSTLDEVAQGRADEALKDLGDEVQDLVPALGRLGLNYEDIVQAFRSGNGPVIDAINRYRELKEETALLRAQQGDTAGIESYARAHGESADALLAEWNALGVLNETLGANAALSVKSIENGQAIARIRAEEAAAHGRSADALSRYHDSVDLATSAVEDHTAAEERATQQAEARRASLEAVADAMDRQRSAALQLVGGELAVNEAQRQARESAAGLDETLGGLTAGTDEYNAALEGAVGEQLNAASAAAQYREEQMSANGQTVNGAVQVQLMKEELQRLAGQLSGPLREAILGYINDLNSIPTNVRTNLTVSRNGSDFRTTPEPRALGGPTRAGHAYEIFDTTGYSEILREGTKTYLLAGSDGEVVPLDKLSKGHATRGLPGQVQAEDGSWVDPRFWSGIKPTGRVQAEDGSFVGPGFYDPPKPMSQQRSFWLNSNNDPNKGKPGYVQAEDGSWVPSGFYNKPDPAAEMSAEQRAAMIANGTLVVAGGGARDLQRFNRSQRGGTGVNLTIEFKNYGIANPIDIGRQIVSAVSLYFNSGGDPNALPYVVR